MTVQTAQRADLDTLKDAIVSLYRKRRCTPTTVSHVRKVFSLLTGAAGVKLIADLDDEAVERFASVLRAAMPNVQDRTRVHYLNMFRAICGHGVRLGVLPRVPTFPFLPQSNTFQRVRELPSLSFSDVKRLLSHLQSESKSWKWHRMYALVGLIVYAGFTKTTAVLLRIESVDLEDGRIGVMRIKEPAKGKLKGRIRFSKDLEAILRSWIPRAGSEWLIPATRRKGPFGVQTRGRYSPLGHLQIAGKAVGIPGLTFEMLHRFFTENSERSIPQLEGAAPAAQPVPVVEMKGPKHEVLVRGKSKGVLSSAQYQAVKLLLSVFPGGLDLEAMNKRTGRTAWRNTLRRLRTDPDWAAAIGFPGIGYPGKTDDLYRIEAY